MKRVKKEERNMEHQDNTELQQSLTSPPQGIDISVGMLVYRDTKGLINIKPIGQVSMLELLGLLKFAECYVPKWITRGQTPPSQER